MSTAWIMFLLVGAGLSIYGFYLTRKRG